MKRAVVSVGLFKPVWIGWFHNCINFTYEVQPCHNLNFQALTCSHKLFFIQTWLNFCKYSPSTAKAKSFFQWFPSSLRDLNKEDPQSLSCLIKPFTSGILKTVLFPNCSFILSFLPWGRDVGKWHLTVQLGHIPLQPVHLLCHYKPVEPFFIAYCGRTVCSADNHARLKDPALQLQKEINTLTSLKNF